MELPEDTPDSALTAAGNYLNARIGGRTIAAAQKDIFAEIAGNRAQLDLLTADLVRKGLALPPAAVSHENFTGHIVVRGQSKLLNDVHAIEDLEKARRLLAMLEEQQSVARLLDATQQADGVGIFIGSENRVFDHAGWSMIIAPYRTPENNIVGAVGVIGPTRLNYSRIIPIVDYTAKVMEKLI
jgi:heat-inducible transcriptional repressor